MEKLIEDPNKRKVLGANSLSWFTSIYLRPYLKSATPSFHWDIYNLLMDENIPFLEIVAFRGSAKSTLASLAYPLWCAVTGRKKFIILLSDTTLQSHLLIRNLISELEHNEDLKEDFGSFRSDEEWQASNLNLVNGTRIIARSRGQRIRGLRHREDRPDLVICDDVETTDHVRTKDRRDKTEEWFFSEVRPAVDVKTGKIVLVGNLLHTDSFYMRAKAVIGKIDRAKFAAYPLHNEDGVNVWPEEYPEDRVNEIKASKGAFYLREYELKIVPDEGQVVERVHYYQKLPMMKRLAIGTDLAISEKETADYTAIAVVGEDEDRNMYSIYNWYGRVNFNKTLTKIDEVYRAMKDKFKGVPCVVGWEDVGYQRAGQQEAQRRHNYPIRPIKRTKDKRARLQTIEPRLSTGQMKFREDGDEDAIIQILNFGVEQHDDLMDAYEMAISQLGTQPRPSIAWV